MDAAALAVSSNFNTFLTRGSGTKGVGAGVSMLLFAAAIFASAGPIQAAPAGGENVTLTEARRRIMSAASELLEEAQISYVYGGYQVGDGDECLACNTCLTTNRPKPRGQLAACPVCSRCGLDCSHFTAQVFATAGLKYPYLATETMLLLSAEELRRRYGLIDFGVDAAQAQPGDFLVYEGHVVLLEKRHADVESQPKSRGDIIHATGGRDVRAPGEGIQRERFINLANFRGPLKRILRHAKLGGTPSRLVSLDAIGLSSAAPASPPVPARPPRAAKVDANTGDLPAVRRPVLRPVEKQHQE